MMCPMKLTHEMSDLSGTLSSSMTRCGHEATERSRSGAGDETTGRNLAGDGQTDHVVSSGRDPGHQLPADAALERQPLSCGNSMQEDSR
jgi:hypothetical protein